MRYFYSLFLFVLLCIIVPTKVKSQDSVNFLPSKIPYLVHAIKAVDNIVVDGNLNEHSWQIAPAVKNFFRIEPRQGGKYLYATWVKVVFDKKNIYFGVFCKDTAGKKGVRVQDYRRDFTTDNDQFNIQLDPQNTKRFCVSFQTTPLGNQGDQQVFDDQLLDADWDALWKVKTMVTDSGYYAEFAIPFKSLRYARQGKDSIPWNVTFSRIARRDNEQTVFPAIPQIYDQYKMSYGAELVGLELPPPSVNIQLQPYALYQYSTSTNANNVTTSSSSLKYGGEAKWAVNPHAVLNLTFNTDFAQAEVDQAVNNLTRFNILFPEKRQFFLEDQGVFAGASISDIKPYFSRSIGLSNTGFDAAPVPIDFGTRFTDRTQDRTFAGLFVHQEGSDSEGASDFSVLRYLKNYGKENNVGIMFTDRLDEAAPSKGLDEKNNFTLTVDGLNRPTNKLTIQYMVSFSKDSKPDSSGVADYFNINYNSDKFFFYYQSELVSAKYDPAMGYVFQNNVFTNQTVEFYKIRPKSKKWSWIKEWEIGFDANYYQNSSNFVFQQANLYIYPLYIILKNGGVFQYAIRPNWQNINYDFSLLNVKLAERTYNFIQHELSYNSDPSKRFSYSGDFYLGDYYNGTLQSAALGFRLAPTPKLALVENYTHDQFHHFGEFNSNFHTDLYITQLLISLSTKIQLSGTYQYNSLNNQGQWNARASWEFAPLSYVYLVYNENNYKFTPVSNQSLIAKITFLKQF